MRELCDVAYSYVLEETEKRYLAQVSAGAQWENTDDPLGDAVTRFEERAGLRENPEDIALELHRQFMKAQGKEWDETPVGAGSGQWWDQDVEFTSMEDLDAGKKRSEGVEFTKRLFRRN